MREKLAGIKQYFIQKDKPKLIDYLLVAVIIMFCYISYNHGDITATATHGKDLLECVLNGNMSEFYVYTEGTAAYLPSIYIVFAIWSIPVIIVMALSHQPLWGTIDFDYFYSHIGIMVWYKLLPTIFFFLTAYLIYKIVIELKMSKNAAKWTSFLFIASPIAMFSQFVFGGYDSLGLFFIMLAFLMFVKKKYYWFSIITAVAVTFKLFPILIFIPMILLVEKRVIHLVKYFAISMSGYIIYSVVLASAQGYGVSQTFTEGLSMRLIYNGMPLVGSGTVSIFLVAMMVICVVAYNKKIESEEELGTFAVYIPTFVYGIMFAFILWHPQWVILLIPFMALSTIQHKKMNSVIILEIAMFIGYIGMTAFTFSGNVDTNMFGCGIFARIFDLSDIQSIGNVMGIININCYVSLFVGAILIMLFMWYPTKKNIENYSLCVKEGGEVVMSGRSYIWVRTMSILFFIVPSIYYLMKVI